MSVKWKLGLPLVNVPIAVALITRFAQRPFSISDPSWLKPDWQICCALNGPATVVRILLTMILDDRWPHSDNARVILQTACFVPVIGLVWYTVGVELSGRGESVVASRLPFRRSVDVGAIILGLLVGLTGLSAMGDLAPLRFYSGLVGTLYFVWAVVIVGFYSRDLRACLKRRSETENSES